MTALRSALEDRSDFYLCIARAFLAPRSAAEYEAITRLLADDLDELGGRLGYALDAHLTELRRALEQIPDQQSLLQLYSTLFLAPPAPVRINTGMYLDGGVMGDSVAILESLYRRRGVGRSETFRDLSDHLSVQLEFLAFLLASAAERLDAGDEGGARELLDDAAHFQDSFLLAWAEPFREDLQKAAAESGLSAAYLHLAAVLETAVRHDTCGRAVTREDAAAQAPECIEALAQRPPEMRPCRLCGRSYLREPHIAEIAARLEEAGLGTEHLEQCPTCRPGTREGQHAPSRWFEQQGA
jgi:putative dimethyl sulfoxide reductase chaperone